MSKPESAAGAAPALRSAVVVRVDDRSCRVVDGAGLLTVGFAPQFPTPYRERVSPGHRLALAAAADGRSVALWRWYDAVVVAVGGDAVRIWEPAHGEVTASCRSRADALAPGTRAYASAGLPGADWWVAGPVDDVGPDVVELAEVADLYTRHGLWESALG